jgi:GxxExxY protein
MLVDPSGTNHITRDIIGAAIRIHRIFGPGLLESAYAACLALELSERGHTIEVKKPVLLVYRSVRLDAAYYLDLLVDGRVIVELKSVEALAPIHEAQMLTYLRLTQCPVGLLINFNVQVLKDGIQRVVNSMART